MHMPFSGYFLRDPQASGIQSVQRFFNRLAYWARAGAAKGIARFPGVLDDGVNIVGHTAKVGKARRDGKRQSPPANRQMPRLLPPDRLRQQSAFSDSRDITGAAFHLRRRKAPLDNTLAGAGPITGSLEF